MIQVPQVKLAERQTTCITNFHAISYFTTCRLSSVLLPRTTIHCGHRHCHSWRDISRYGKKIYLSYTKKLKSSILYFKLYVTRCPTQSSSYLLTFCPFLPGSSTYWLPSTEGVFGRGEPPSSRLVALEISYRSASSPGCSRSLMPR